MDEIRVGGIESPAILRLSKMDHDDSRGRNNLVDDKVEARWRDEDIWSAEVDLVTEMGMS